MKAEIKKVKRGWRVKFVFGGAAPDLSIEEYYTQRGSAIRATKRTIRRMASARDVPVRVLDRAGKVIAVW